MGLCGASLEGTHNLLSAPSSSWLVLSPFRFSRKVRPWCMMQSNDAPDIHPSFSLALARQEGWGVLCASSRLPRRTHGWRGRDYAPHRSVLVSFPMEGASTLVRFVRGLRRSPSVSSRSCTPEKHLPVQFLPYTRDVPFPGRPLLPGEPNMQTCLEHACF